MCQRCACCGLTAAGTYRTARTSACQCHQQLLGGESSSSWPGECASCRHIHRTIAQEIWRLEGADRTKGRSIRGTSRHRRAEASPPPERQNLEIRSEIFPGGRRARLPGRAEPLYARARVLGSHGKHEDDDSQLIPLRFIRACRTQVVELAERVLDTMATSPSRTRPPWRRIWFVAEKTLWSPSEVIHVNTLERAPLVSLSDRLELKEMSKRRVDHGTQRRRLWRRRIPQRQTYANTLGIVKRRVM